MKPLHNTYSLPNEILDDLSEMSLLDQEDLKRVWSLVEPTNLVSSDNGKAKVRESVFAQIASARPSGVSVQKLPAPVARIYTMRLRLMAAACVVLVGLSMMLSPSNQHFRSEAGSLLPTLVSLSDGSIISLEAGSRMTVSESFGDSDRRVILHGKAFFDVKPGPLAFEVSTFDAKTVVHGTSFSVEAWPGSIEASTEVVVHTGKVSVLARQKRIDLMPGERTFTSGQDHAPVEPQIINVDQSSYWKTGGFYFDQEPIGNVIEEVERRFDVRVAAPTSIKLRRFSYSKQSAESAGEVLGDLAATIGVRYRPISNGFELYLD